jgi:hypothetical protein
MRKSLVAVCTLLACVAALSHASRPAGPAGALEPGSRVLLDAHNAYPNEGRWADRIDRALSTGVPVAIEQDLVWHAGRSLVSHGEPFTGAEPTLDTYFFQRIRPVVEQALREDRRDDWPVITLNLDFKSNEPEHHRIIWELLGRYERWLTTAERVASAADIAPLAVGPVLVLTGEADEQEQSFSTDRTHELSPMGEPAVVERRAGGTAQGRGLDVGGRRQTCGTRASVSRGGPVDQVLHAERSRSGR